MKLRYEMGAVVRLNDSRATIAKVLDAFQFDDDPKPFYILETVDGGRRYELTEDDIQGLLNEGGQNNDA